MIKAEYRGYVAVTYEQEKDEKYLGIYPRSKYTELKKPIPVFLHAKTGFKEGKPITITLTQEEEDESKET